MQCFRIGLLATCVAVGLDDRAVGQDRLVHAGSRAVGTVTVTRVLPDPTFRMHFSGDEEIEYQVNPRDPSVKRGGIRVYELYSDSWPLDNAGVGYRNTTDGIFSPPFLEPYTLLTGQSMTANSVTLDYTDTIDGVHHRRHTYTLEGKSLRVRVQDLDQNPNYFGNYSGFFVGPTKGTEFPKYILMQGGLSTPITMFRNGSQRFFLGNMLDLYVSNSADWDLYQQPNITSASTSFQYNISTFNLYKKQSNNQICAPLDDTINITVSRKIKDVLVTPTQDASPYRGLLTGRTMALWGGNNWQPYLQQWDLFRQWGMDDLAGYFFFGWTSRAIDPPLTQNAGPDWYPARDPVNWETMIRAAVNQGFLMSAYMAFNEMPASADPTVYDPSHIARRANGGNKVGAQSGFPSIATTASGVHAQRESALMKADYGINMAYIDIQTYASPSRGADGDHVDQISTSPWAKTLKSAIADQRYWMRKINDALQGPLVGEGSISTAGASHEWLWTSACDSVQRVINTGNFLDASHQPLGSQFSPTAWPVIPEYELRVFNRLQCNHGNGFGSRFFSLNDGPECVEPSGATLYPLTTTALDLYRIYEITYGHSAFVHTNGPYDGPIGNSMHYADIIKEHYMMNALQQLYFEAGARSIHYVRGGVLKTFEQVMAETDDLTVFKDAQIRIGYPNGLEVYVNHNVAPWNVVAGGVSYTIPENGFVAAVPGTPFVCFSAIAPGTGGFRVDYCYAPNRYEYFDGRGNVNAYAGIDTLGIKKMRLRNFVHNSTVWSIANGDIQVSQGVEPAVVRIDVLPAVATLAPGARLGLKAVATYSNGAVRNVTSLVQWSGSSPLIGRVNQGGVFTGVGPGVATVNVTTYGGGQVFPAHMTVN